MGGVWFHSLLRYHNRHVKTCYRLITPNLTFVAGKRVVHMKKFPLNGDSEGKEASLCIVPINVKGKTHKLLCDINVNNLYAFETSWFQRLLMLQEWWAMSHVVQVVSAGLLMARVNLICVSM